MLDTLLDLRTAYYFQTSPIGAMRDAGVTDGVNNANWSAVWDARTVRSDNGYTVEMAIPFKSLRYRGGGRVGVSPHFAMEPSPDVELGFVVSPTARLGFSSLTQFTPSSHSLTSSLQMRWEYSPGSDVYAVYSDGRHTASGHVSSLQTRSFAIKATRLLRL